MSCLRQSFYLPRKLFISNRNSPVKFFSALSPSRNKLNSNYVSSNFIFNKISNPKPIQPRHFSLNSVNYIIESIRTSEVSRFVTNLLIQSHDFTGLTWTATIIGAAAIMKLIISLPSGIYQLFIAVKLEQTKGELDVASKALKEAIRKKAIIGQWTAKKTQQEFRKEIKRLWSSLVVKNNCHPFKFTALFLVQFPFWLVLTLAIRSLVINSYSNQMENLVTALQFRVGGPFWCQNLVETDKTYILPAINSLSILITNEVGLLSKIQPQMTQGIGAFIGNKLVPNFVRVFAIVFFFISALSPAAVSLFWTSSSLIGLGQNLLLLSPRARRFFKIPKDASELQKPYSHIFNKAVEKLLFWKK